MPMAPGAVSGTAELDEKGTEGRDNALGEKNKFKGLLGNHVLAGGKTGDTGKVALALEMMLLLKVLTVGVKVHLMQVMMTITRNAVKCSTCQGLPNGALHASLACSTQCHLSEHSTLCIH